MSTLTDLIQGVTQPQYFADLMAKHKTNGVPTDAWLSDENIGLALTLELSQLLAALRGSNTDPSKLAGVSYLAATLFLQFASGEGLTAFAKSQYGLDRIGSSPTQGRMRLVGSVNSPTYNIVPGQLIVGSTANAALTYTNVTGGTLPANGILDLVFRATASGARFNISNTQTMFIKTTLPGVSINNPIYPLSPSWITLAGTDEESDIALKNRCLSRWGTVGVECNAESLIYWATLPPVGYTTSPVKYVRILPNFISNGMVTGYWPGVVSVVLGNDGGALLPADKAAVISNFENPQKYGIGRQINYLDLTFLNVTLSGVVNIYKESGVDPLLIQQQVEDSIADFQSFLQIGEIVTVQKIGARMESANKLAIKEVIVSSPTATLVPSFTQKISFTIGTISYVLV